MVFDIFNDCDQNLIYANIRVSYLIYNYKLEVPYYLAVKTQAQVVGISQKDNDFIWDIFGLLRAEFLIFREKIRWFKEFKKNT